MNRTIRNAPTSAESAGRDRARGRLRLHRVATAVIVAASAGATAGLVGPDLLLARIALNHNETPGLDARP